ncbi:hypothetical protein [Nitrospirillum sp. BR 11163]|uniref:hypothetical protein n=1 Tax=Nitrospirillum sp. BR 11163 TaxID=3104323 RepID=UPI002AFF3A11|nr:hypothetical protein [Nitrospirillum sp. BR 11163]MEA1675473.1 hypothetical protein [Nitrospirillum sp. BR 11163]
MMASAAAVENFFILHRPFDGEKFGSSGYVNVNSEIISDEDNGSIVVRTTFEYRLEEDNGAFEVLIKASISNPIEVVITTIIAKKYAACVAFDFATMMAGEMVTEYLGAKEDEKEKRSLFRRYINNLKNNREKYGAATAVIVGGCFLKILAPI